MLTPWPSCNHYGIAISPEADIQQAGEGQAATVA